MISILSVNQDNFVFFHFQCSSESLNVQQLQILSYYHQKDTPPTLDVKKVYEGRVSVDVDIRTGKADMKLSSITLADNKVFECRIQIPGDDEGKPADTARLVVLGNICSCLHINVQLFSV